MAEKRRGLVGSSCGLTVILGGFQSARIDCWLALPSDTRRFRDVHKRCESFVYGKVRDEVLKIYKRNEEIKGSLSAVALYNADLKKENNNGEEAEAR